MEYKANSKNKKDAEVINIAERSLKKIMEFVQGYLKKVKAIEFDTFCDALKHGGKLVLQNKLQKNKIDNIFIFMPCNTKETLI